MSSFSMAAQYRSTKRLHDKETLSENRVRGCCADVDILHDVRHKHAFPTLIALLQRQRHRANGAEGLAAHEASLYMRLGDALIFPTQGGGKDKEIPLPRQQGNFLVPTGPVYSL